MPSEIETAFAARPAVTMTPSAAESLVSAYRWHRQNSFERKGVPAFARDALRYAREDVANGKTRYPSHGSAWNPAFKMGGEKHMRWIENPRACGLRFVGYADKLDPSMRHTGWFTDHGQHDLVRGVVFQMPARDGKPRFVAGYDDADNGKADSNGPVALSFDVMEGEAVRTYWHDNPRDHGAAVDAAHAADRLAERVAEDRRNHDAAWQAGRRYAELGEEIAAERKAALALLRERRLAPRLAPSTFPTLCATIRDSVRSSLRTIEAARGERAKLKAGDYVADWLPGFWSGDDDLRAAFAEGANG